MRRFKYNFELSENSSIFFDLLRIIAIHFVVIGHGIGIMNVIWYQGGRFPLFQRIGVMIFFLISGFLITYATLSKANDEMYTFKEFYIERFSRIYIVYVPVLILIIFLDFILFIYLAVPNPHNSYNVITFFYNLLMLQDAYSILGGYTSFGSARVLWTLSVLWWIYMIFGWIILGTRTVNKYYTVILIFILFLIIIILIGMGERSDIKLVLFITWTCGALIALSLNKNTLNTNEILTNKGNSKQKNTINGSKIKKTSFFSFFSSKPKLSLFISLIFLLLACFQVYRTKRPYEVIFGLLLAASLFFLIIFTNQSHFKISEKKKTIIRFFASYSFTLYLLHFTLVLIFKTFTNTYSPYLLFIIYLLISNVLSLIIAYFTEMRYKKLRKTLLRKFSKSYIVSN